MKRKWNEFHHVTKSCERNSEDNFKTFHALFTLSSLYFAPNQWLILIFCFCFRFCPRVAAYELPTTHWEQEKSFLNLFKKYLILLPPICALTKWGHFAIERKWKTGKCQLFRIVNMATSFYSFLQSSFFCFWRKWLLRSQS